MRYEAVMATETDKIFFSDEPFQSTIEVQCVMVRDNFRKLDFCFELIWLIIRIDLISFWTGFKFNNISNNRFLDLLIVYYDKLGTPALNAA
jgi:hypothetical protein